MIIPGLTNRELRKARGFALQLFDGFTRQSKLVGQVAVSIANQKPPLEKSGSATFMFMNIPPGNYTVSVQPSAVTQYYLPVPIPIPITVPATAALWQTYPDPTLADKKKPLNDPSQAPAYWAQRLLATLVPSTHYPFPPSATLVRGTVYDGKAPVKNATVSRVGGPGSTTSDVNGGFVLFFDDVGASGETVTINASAPPRADVSKSVALQQGSSVSMIIGWNLGS